MDMCIVFVCVCWGDESRAALGRCFVVGVLGEGRRSWVCVLYLCVRFSSTGIRAKRALEQGGARWGRGRLLTASRDCMLSVGRKGSSCGVWVRDTVAMEGSVKWRRGAVAVSACVGWIQDPLDGQAVVASFTYSGWALQLDEAWLLRTTNAVPHEPIN